MTETMTSLAKLIIVREILEDEAGTTLLFQDGGHGRISRGDVDYAYFKRLAERSKERVHPVGVGFGDGHAISELINADNDVPRRILADDSDHARVLFQGHDGIFRLKLEHPEFARLRRVLKNAIQKKARVWFVSQGSDLALLDVIQAGDVSGGSVPIELKISFVIAPDHLLKTAEEILHSAIRSTKALCRDIRAVAKAYIDEADELKRAIHEIQTNAARIQIESRSPQEMIKKAKRLQLVRLASKEEQEKVRAIMRSYLLIAEKNRQHYEDFKEKNRNLLPKT